MQLREAQQPGFVRRGVETEPTWPQPNFELSRTLHKKKKKASALKMVG